MSDPTARPSSHVWLALAAWVAALAAGAYLWFGWCTFPLYEWNEVRLAPAFALRHGITLYPPIGGGPVSTWIYGPLGATMNVPATFASSATTALQCASFINLLTLTLPAAVIICSTRERAGVTLPLRVIALAAVILLLPPTSLTFQVADHAAIALGLLSCWCLTRSKTPGTVQLAAAAGLCVLAAWAKQTSVFLPVAQILFLWLERERRAARRYLAWCALLAVISLALAAAVSNFANLWLNLVQIPARLPWGDLREKLALRSWALVSYVVLPLIAIVICRARKLWIDSDRESGRFLRCGVIVFLVLLPPGLLAFFKIGGDINALQSPFFLAPAAVLALATEAQVRRRYAGWLVAALAVLILLRTPQLSALPAGPLTAKLEHAAELSRARPASTWMPFNPVVTFYTDAKLYHVEDGIATRHLAGFALREPDFRRYLPSPLSAVIYPAGNQQPFALQLLREFDRQTITGQWALYERQTAR